MHSPPPAYDARPEDTEAAPFEYETGWQAREGGGLTEAQVVAHAER
jgi:hypothetical protein